MQITELLTYLMDLFSYLNINIWHKGKVYANEAEIRKSNVPVHWLRNIQIVCKWNHFETNVLQLFMCSCIGNTNTWKGCVSIWDITHRILLMHLSIPLNSGPQGLFSYVFQSEKNDQCLVFRKDPAVVMIFWNSCLSFTHLTVKVKASRSLKDLKSLAVSWQNDMIFGVDTTNVAWLESFPTFVAKWNPTFSPLDNGNILHTPVFHMGRILLEIGNRLHSCRYLGEIFFVWRSSSQGSPYIRRCSSVDLKRDAWSRFACRHIDRNPQTPCVDHREAILPVAYFSDTPVWHTHICCSPISSHWDNVYWHGGTHLLLDIGLIFGWWSMVDAVCLASIYSLYGWLFLQSQVLLA